MTPAAAPGVGGSGAIDQRPAVDLHPVDVDVDAGVEGEAGSADGDDRVVAVAVQRPQRRAQVGERPRLGLVGPQRAGDEQPWLRLAAQGQEGDQPARRIGDVDDRAADVQGEAADEGELDRVARACPTFPPPSPPGPSTLR